MPYHIKPVITKEEYIKLLEHIKTSKKKNKKQYMVALVLGFEAGMRISEIVGLKYPHVDFWTIEPLQKEQLDFDRNYITVKQGKGQKDRIVPLPKALTRAALDYIPLKLSREALQWYIKKIGKEILGKDISFHTLRAGFATHLLDNNMPMHQVQLLMGHSRIDTTGVYARASPKNAVENARELF